MFNSKSIVKRVWVKLIFIFSIEQAHINESFSKLAEALYIADRKARESVEAR